MRKLEKISLAGNPISPNCCQMALVASTLRIPKGKAEVFDRLNPFEITERVEEKNRNGVIAGFSEDGIGIGGNGADEGEMNGCSSKARHSSCLSIPFGCFHCSNSHKVLDSSVRLRLEKDLDVWQMRLISSEEKQRPEDSTC